MVQRPQSYHCRPKLPLLVHRVSLEQGGSVDYGRRGRRYFLSAHGTNVFVIFERSNLVQPVEATKMAVNRPWQSKLRNSCCAKTACFHCNPLQSRRRSQMTLMTFISTLLHSRHCSTKTAMSRFVSALFSKALCLVKFMAVRRVLVTGRPVRRRPEFCCRRQCAGRCVGQSPRKTPFCLCRKYCSHWKKQQRIVAATIVTRRCNGGDPRGRKFFQPLRLTKVSRQLQHGRIRHDGIVLALFDRYEPFAIEHDLSIVGLGQVPSHVSVKGQVQGAKVDADFFFGRLIVTRFRGNAVDGHVLLQQLDSDYGGAAASALASSWPCDVYLHDLQEVVRQDKKLMYSDSAMERVG
jgi:hypothetical protein